MTATSYCQPVVYTRAGLSQNQSHRRPVVLRLVAVLALGDIVGALYTLKAVLNVLPFLLPGSMRVTKANVSRWTVQAVM